MGGDKCAREGVVCGGSLHVLVANSDTLLDIDDVALVRREVWRLYVILRSHFLQSF